MPYRFNCPSCSRIITRIYKPKDTIKCTYAGCRHEFPTPTGSFLVKSVEEQMAEAKKSIQPIAPPKIALDIDMNEFLFSESEDDDDETEKDVVTKKNSDKELLFSDSDDNDNIEKNKKPIEKKKRAIVEDSDNESLFSEKKSDSIEKDINKDSSKTTEKDDDFQSMVEDIPIPPTRYAKRAENRQRLIMDGVPASAIDGETVYKEQPESDIDDMDLMPSPILGGDEDDYALNFSSEDEHEDKENKKPKRRAKEKAKEKSKEFAFPTNDNSDDSEYDQPDEEEEEEEEEIVEEDKFASPIFSDIEQDSEEEEEVEKPRKKRRTKEEMAQASGSTLRESLARVNREASESSTSKRKNITREIYTAGGKSIKYRVDENGVETPILTEPSEKKSKQRKYAPKPGNKFNPYIVFNRLERQKIKDVNPGLPNNELSIKVGRAFAALTPEKKQKFIDIAKREKEEFEKKHHLQKQQLPKTPPNAYLLFKSRKKQEVNKELEGSKDAYAFSRTMAKLWKELPKEEKYVYQEEAKRLKKEFIEQNPDIYKQKMDRMIQRVRARKLQNKRDLLTGKR